MGKKILFFIAFLFTSFYAEAVHVSDNEDFPLNKGWFAGSQLGAQYYIGDFNFKENATLGYGFSSNVEGYVGKWLNQMIALRGVFSFSNVPSGEIVLQKPPREPKIITNSFKMLHAEMDVLLDLRYLIRGRKMSYSFQPLMGVGYAINTTKRTNGISIAFGGIHSWKLKEHLNLNIETRVRLLESDVDGFEEKEDVQFILNTGFTYSF